MLLLKRLFGVLALACGVGILAWVGYNLIWPTEEYGRHRRSLRTLSVPILMIWAGWKWVSDGGPGLERQAIDFTAPELHSALAEARRTLPRFVAEVRKNVDGAYVKFPLQTDMQVTEHVWAYVHSYQDGLFNVSLANELATQRTPTETRRSVSETDVEDWQIMLPGGKIRGAYSISGAFKYLENRGARLNRTMRKQKAQLIDAFF